jgi:dihydrofolate reductase
VIVSLIVAAAENDVIGRDNDLPWDLPEDRKRFKRLTNGHVLVSGRRNQDSIVERLGRPLPGRITVVVTRQARPNDGPVLYASSVEGALRTARSIEDFAGRDEVFVIGGAEIYALALPEIDRIYLTRVHDTVAGDVVMPEGWLDGFEVIGREPQDGYTYEQYERAS